MALEVKVPAVGESVQEGMIESWHKQTGDWVEQDDVLLEIETDKATVEIVAEGSGTLEILVEAGQVVKVGQVIARLAEGEGAPKPSDQKQETAIPEDPPVEAPSQVKDPGPAVRKMAEEHSVDLSQVPGTGKDGRVTKGDLLGMTEKKETAATPPPQAPSPPTESPLLSGAREDTRKPMSMIRRRIAERLLESQKQAAILTTFNEIDMSSLLDLRSRYKETFQKKYNVKLGFMGFFLKASVEALMEFPLVNAYIEGTDIVYHNYCDVGVAVSTKKGLVVPVLRNVEKSSLAEIELKIADFAAKARDNKISVDDLTGGTFTVSNGGVFGSLLSTPILNPPQSAILGMHKTQQRPIVTEDGEIVSRPMMYVALSYDHRIIDGKEAVGFLVRIKNLLEDPRRFLVGV